MAANPLIVCDPATSWYAFTHSLSWSNECEVAEVLSDIPPMTVGVLVFTVSALFFVVKRVPLSAIWLFFSALLSFVAAVLDASRTLSDGAAMNSTFTTNKAVIRTREVLFALSIGFRFLFYWTYVAEPSRKDLLVVSTQTVQKIRFLTFERSHALHSGSWGRWGLPGKFLGVGLLAVIMTITALQIVWRVAPQFHQYSSVYGTGAALQLLVSFLLLLKLLSNTLTLGSPSNMLVHTFKECLAPISGLLINISIGVGDLLSFAFAESTVGRLLQAFEFCIIVIFVVVAAFLKYRDILVSPMSPHREKHGDFPFRLPEPTRGSTFRITPPLIETPRMSTILGATTQSKVPAREALHWSARRSLNHVSSWLSSRVSRIRTRYEDEEVRLWNAENARVDPPYTGNMDTSSMSSTQEPRDLSELLREASVNVNRTSIVSVLDAQSALVLSMKGSIHSGRTLHPSRTDVQQSTVPPPVRITAAPVLSAPSPVSSRVKYVGSTTPKASPVYGLSDKSHTPDSNSRTSLDEVLRQKAQLDQSIETLKLFSAGASASSSRINSTASPKSVELGRSPSIGQRTVSSEVSLSSFPIPPWLSTPIPSLPSSRPASVKRIRGDRRARFAAAGPSHVQDTHAPVTSISSASLANNSYPPHLNSIPHSPLGEENESLSAEAKRSSRFDSGVTEYNVTSFIGGLATPGGPRQGGQEKPSLPTGVETGAETVRINSGVKRLPRTLPVPPSSGLPASPAPAKLSTFARSSILSRRNVSNDPQSIAQYHTDDHGPRALPVVPPSHTPATDRAGERVWIQPVGPPLARETDSPTVALGKRADRARRTFIRPRPPPLVIHSYKEQNPGIPRVQVLADD